MNDIVIDFNTIFLNSGIFVKVKSGKKIKINLIHKTLKDDLDCHISISHDGDYAVAFAVIEK